MIFADNAPKYWAAGLPVIPLYGKAPTITAWQNFHNSMPNENQRELWLKTKGHSNIGLPLGSQSRCVAIDIDTLLDKELALIDSLLPTSPWVRVGSKGKVMMYRYNGEKGFKIKDATGRMICELLAERNQVVLPPSIHPDTKNPYVENVPLVDVLDRLPVLPKDLENILRNALVDKCDTQLSHSGWSRTIDFVSQGSRDVKMTSVAGIYANGVLRGEMSLKEGVEFMRAWCATQVEQVAGDSIDTEKGVRNLVKFLMRNVTGNKRRPLPNGWDVGLSEEEKKQLGLEINTETDVSWSFDKVRTHLKSAIESGDRSDDDIDRVVDYTLDKIARSQSMTSLDIDRALKHIANLSNDIKVPALRKRLVELKQDGVTGTNHTELARAVLSDMNDLIPDEEKHSTQREFNSLRFFNGEFWGWGGSNWEVKNPSEILKHIACEYGHLPAASKSNDHKGIFNVMSSQLDSQLTDVDFNGVNFANGFVDAYGVMHSHSKKYGCTYTLPYCYDKNKANLENAPKFSKFLHSVWGHEVDFEERVACLREVIASTIFGYGPSFARAVLLYGVGKSGKSQLLRIVENLLPADVVSSVTPYDFADKFKPADLCNSVLNICGELDEKKDIPSANFKQVIDGTVMQGQFKGKQVFKFKPKATHWFASNHLPKSKDTTEGFNRRWVILTFNKIVSDKEKVRDIGDIIVAEEREAISAWAIGAMADLHKRADYKLPPSHHKMVNEMRCGNDSLFFFLAEEEAPRKQKDGRIEIDRLYEVYRGFCYNVAGSRPVGLRNFYTRLKEMGIILGFEVGTTFVEGLTLDKSGDKLI